MLDGWLAAARPAAPALSFEGETLSYQDLATQVATRAEQLAAHGVQRGDRVAWYGLNHPEVFVLLFACARMGAMLLPLNWRLSDAEIDAIVADAEPRLVIHDAHFAAKAARFGAHLVGTLQGAAEACPQGREEDPLLLVYTSGSTGKPKGVVLTQVAVAANAAMSVAAHGLTAESRVLNVLPLFHVGGLNILPTPAFSVGAEVVLHQRFEPAQMAAALAEVTHAITVPTVLQAVLETPEWRAADLAGLRSLSIGSTDVPVELIEAVHARGVPVMQVYGATETCPFAIAQTVDDAMDTVGAIGRPAKGCSVRLVADDQDVPDGVPGEIWVKGPNILREYWRSPELTAAAISDGWFKTGDVAMRDADGIYWFADRIKHVIISGGENIYPAEIERVLRRVPGVAEVAVVGRADERWGEVPVAVVVGTADREALMTALRQGLARYKHPKDVVFVDALPRNAMGKVVTDQVRALAQKTCSASVQG
ncbi:O-succinylbenzoic acid--CoA ligase [Candidatus Rhodobacter oscarellae]|uniref:O-succinylbenzoic acid--CoA ligase n=2 Tax=Candidatus Rhodobacter oscarellae TaxID=1675527 RepID=A0A0J9ED07_9RHOB|nr:O-succinylbenzoic acid--CoA ligase [Candidatus Rhodobacter lobularis]